MGKTLLTYDFLKTCTQAGLNLMTDGGSQLSVKHILNNPNTILKNGRTIFCEIIATGLGTPKHIQAMIDAGADFSLWDKFGETALTHAIKMQRMDIIDILINAGTKHLNTAHKNKLDKKSLVHLCVENKQYDIAKVLLQHGAHVDLLDHQYNTPLTRAVILQDIKMVNLLIHHGADVQKYETQMGISTIEMIRTSSFQPQNTHTEIQLIKTLLNAGADPDMVQNCDGKSPLITHYALHKNKTAMRLLLDAGADIHAFNMFQETPLITAVFNSDIDMVDMLMEYGATMNDVARSGSTPLGAALYKKFNTKFLQKIIRRGADVNLCCEQKHTKNYPLHIAVKEGNKEYVDLLLKNGANPLVKNADKETPYIMAVKKFGKNNIITARLKLATDAAKLKQNKNKGMSR